MQRIFLFNPTHELALAANTANYTPPQHLQVLERQLYERNRDLFDTLGMPVLTTSQIAGMAGRDLSGFAPEAWGWNVALRRQAVKAGFDESRLPTLAQLAQWRDIAHRRTAIAILNELRNASEAIEYFVEGMPREVHNEGEISAFRAEHPDDMIVFKLPYSSSGRGILHNPSWRQGSVIAEVWQRDKVADFACLFRCSKGEVAFIGYSLFETQKGQYIRNVFLTDCEIERFLTAYLPLGLLTALREKLCTILTEIIGQSGYEGYLGIDMMICKQNGNYKVHPCVELNMRMTMGVLAHNAASSAPCANALGLGSLHLTHGYATPQGLTAQP